jgi:hypothetical protein
VFFSSALAISVGLNASSAQGLKDLFKEIGKAIEKKVDEQVTQKIENPCIEKEETALIKKVDDDKSGTWVVETTDGRLFQVSTIGIGGKAENGNSVSEYLSQAESAQFTLMDSSRLTKVYQVHINYLSALAEKSGIGGILSDALNQTYKKKMYNDFKFETAAVEGTSLDQKDWCLNVPTNTLRSISLVPEKKK